MLLTFHFLPSPRGSSHWTLLSMRFAYNVTLPLVSSRTSHTKDDMLMECPQGDDTTQCQDSMLCVLLSGKHIAICMTCAIELGIITALQCCARLC